ncbi:AAA family ATPase [Motilimonas cestriensis]|uniref:AAA family ATPase n=1 Tax=Motilimonas cestriensis TaxID=2742685 RepID=UPI003DA46098
MRPIHLTMTAFGPFADTQTIDFAKLGQNPLFLLNGPTGAGKTSILDAICFALYGKSTGDEREAAQMRCDYATPTTLTEVTFEFELGSQRYRIRRVPEQARPKKSGEGTTDQKPEAQLYRLDGAQEVLLVPSKVSEANALIEQLTGLDADQFRQVMVLPQGKFRQLLMADSKEREKIFSQLFQTQIYRKIEDKLKAQAAALRKENDALANQRAGMINALELEEGVSLEDDQTKLAPKLADALALKNTQTQAYEQANNALVSAKSIAADFAALGQLKAEQLKLDEQSGAITQTQQRCERAQQAQQIEPSYQFYLAREQESQLSQKALQQSEEQLKQGQRVASEKAAEFAQLAQLNEQAKAEQAELQKLNGLTVPFNALAELDREIKQAETARLNGQQQLQTFEQKLAQCLQQKQSDDAELAKQQQLAEPLFNLQQQFNALQAHEKTHQQWLKASAELDVLANELKQSLDKGLALKAKDTEVSDLLTRTLFSFHQGQAAKIASSLQLGEQCPVCGSTDHPNLAVSHQHVPTEDEVNQLTEKSSLVKQQRAAERQKYQGIKSQRAEKQQSVTEQALNLGEYVQYSAQQLTQHLQGLKGQVEQAQLAQNQVKIIAARLKQQQQQEEPLRQQVDAESKRVNQLQSQLAQLQGKEASLREQIPTDYRSLAQLELAITAATKALTELELNIQTIRDQHQVAQTALAQLQAANTAAIAQNETSKARQEQALTEFNHQLAAANFADLAAYKQACLTKAEISALTEEINAYQQACQKNQANTAQLTHKLADVSEPDMAQLTQQAEMLLAQKTQAEATWQGLHHRAEQLQKAALQLAELGKKITQVEQEYEVVGTLANVANGQTGNKISLQRFVLSVLLDDVLLDASARLQLMSKGRYRLLRKEERAKGNKASGLELEVEDAYTGKVRSVATLSGGESFMAALAMALGLSEVVQAYAGGIKLDTLFIDEGFGSLDQESLDLAVRTLMDLQSSGRMVGVISHVSEMKEQLSTRVDVSKTSMGSTLTLVLP